MASREKDKKGGGGGVSTEKKMTIAPTASFSGKIRARAEKVKALTEKKWHAMLVDEVKAKFDAAADMGRTWCRYTIPERPFAFGDEDGGRNGDWSDEWYEDDEQHVHNGVEAIVTALDDTSYDEYEYERDEDVVVVFRLNDPA
jgi:hypothetical protein